MRRAARRSVTAMAMATALAVGLGACNSMEKPVATQGSPELGKEAISKYGCGGCHTIPGITGADGLVGPPLIKWSKRGMIAGHLRNSEENLVTWILDPQQVAPGTDMPKIPDLTREEAQNIAAYLMTIK